MKTNSTPCLRNTWKSPKRTNDEAPGRSSARKGFACLCSLWLFIRLSAGQIPRSVRRISLIYRCMQSGAHRPRMGMRAYLPLICAHSQSDAPENAPPIQWETRVSPTAKVFFSRENLARHASHFPVQPHASSVPPAKFQARNAPVRHGDPSIRPLTGRQDCTPPPCRRCATISRHRNRQSAALVV